MYICICIYIYKFSTAVCPVAFNTFLLRKERFLNHWPMKFSMLKFAISNAMRFIVFFLKLGEQNKFFQSRGEPTSDETLVQW